MKTWLKVAGSLSVAAVISIGAYDLFYVIPAGLKVKEAAERLGSVQTCIADAAIQKDPEKIQAKLEDVKFLEGQGYETCRNVLQSQLLTLKLSGF